MWPDPTEGPAQWFRGVAFGWLALVTVVAVASPGLARKVAASMADVDRPGTTDR